MSDRQIRWVILMSGLLSILGVQSYAEMIDPATSPSRTWKVVEEMTPEELKDVELRTDTPRHPQLPYMPAEAYPFVPPYTAEEMGYRLMEFTQRPRWSCMFANHWGSISAQGVLMNPGKSVTFMNYPDPQGVAAEFVKKPGEEMYRYLNQNTFPPDAEGSQRMTIRYRTDHEHVKKEEAFFYSPSIRRVRHQVPFRRQDKFPNQAQTTDDATGRDAWEYTWKLIGMDVLSHTVRFPVTRPTVVLGTKGDGTLREVRTSDIKLMGETYPYYTATGGVECYVVEARAREEWLPDYYAPRILYWLEKHSFYPLRIEQYGEDGKLAMVETRISEMFNPALHERGYGPLFVLYWDIGSDLMSYNIRDNHRIKQWSAEETEAFFNPDFMRRQWYLDLSVKSQAGVAHPDLFFLRPPLEEGKFPGLRPIQLPVAVTARVDAQEKAGRLVFEVEAAARETVAAQPPPVLRGSLEQRGENCYNKRMSVSYGMVHGRFQPFHLGHLEYALSALQQCDHLIVGITNPDPAHIVLEPADPDRHLPAANLFTFFERQWMVRAALLEARCEAHQVSVVPFPIHHPERWQFYCPPGTTQFVRLFSAWGREKGERFQTRGWPVVVLDAGGKKQVSGTEVRRRLSTGQGWEDLVPFAVAQILREVGAMERVRNVVSNQ